MVLGGLGCRVEASGAVKTDEKWPVGSLKSPENPAL